MGKDARARAWAKTARGMGANLAFVDIDATAEQGSLRKRTVRRRVLNASTGTMSVLVIAHAYAEAQKQGSVNMGEAIKWAQGLPVADRPW